MQISGYSYGCLQLKHKNVNICLNGVISSP